MLFLVDENLLQQVCAIAEERGHQATWVHDELPGAEDRVIMDRLRQTRETLVPRDVRFVNLVLASMMQDAGLAGAVLIREQRMIAVRHAWRHYLDRDPEQLRALVVLTEGRIRTRHVV